MKKTVLMVLFMVICANIPMCAQNAAAAADSTEKYVFPQWAKDLRRADIIAFGVFPFAWFLASLAIDLQRSAENGWKDSGYYPWPATGQNPVPWTNTEYINAITIASFTAVAVALTDFLIIQVKRGRADKRARELAPTAPVIRRTPAFSPPSEGAEVIAEPDSGEAAKEGGP